MKYINEVRSIAREIFISDIHGQCEAFTSLLTKLDYDPAEDILYLLGDYIDRGPQSYDVIDYLLELKDKAGPRITFLKGNHEAMMLHAFQNEEDSDVSLWMQNGGKEALRSYVGDDLISSPFDEIQHVIRRDYPDHLDFIQNLQLYEETKDHILVHAGIDPSLDNWKEASAETFVWMRSPFLETNHSTGKTVIFGHTPTLTLHQDSSVWFQSDKIGIDGGAGFQKQLNALIYENAEYSTVSVPIEA
ncbi:serine/threonine protein phosphatase [Salibacterium salarium]|uniref:Serine/threonine protein phosphatase n=1 Tax=Salibacterium salarium TaxID=284579 RepID=A0A3R9PM74_9BACI|nr:metallophosphoesterase family protein [Salibacterium salarium]RSL33891.1 serine/threonine protein phosphatase [Salibacterium salarium]